MPTRPARRGARGRRLHQRPDARAASLFACAPRSYWARRTARRGSSRVVGACSASRPACCSPASAWRSPSLFLASAARANSSGLFGRAARRARRRRSACSCASLEWGGSVPTQLLERISTARAHAARRRLGLPGRRAQGDCGVGAAAAARRRRDARLAAGSPGVRSCAGCSSTPERERRRASAAGSAGSASHPATPGGAIAARSLMYWFRDRRYIVNLARDPDRAASSWSSRC